MPAGWGGVEWELNDYVYAILDANFVLAYSTAWFRKMARLTAEASRPRDAQALAEEVPKDWELGRQYQRCPVCLKVTQLLAACNRMICPKPCKTHYCYICGKEVGEGGLKFHWQKGGCPQYNRPDDEDARFAPGVGYNYAREVERERLERMRWVELRSRPDKKHTEQLFAYTWSVATQNADERTRVIMQDILRFLTLGEDLRPDAPMLDDVNWVMYELIRYRPSHGLNHSDWVRILIHSRLTLRHAITRPGELPRPANVRVPIHSEPYPITSRTLNAPVGGVFNMADKADRVAAYAWAGGRGMAWSDWSGQRNNFAIFVSGPGGPEPNNASAITMLFGLQRAGSLWTHARVNFTGAGLVGDAIVVQILPEALVAVRLERPLVEANPLYDIRDWVKEPIDLE